MRSSLLKRYIIHFLNAVWNLFVIFPVMAVFFASFQSEEALMTDLNTFIPIELTLDNFRLILSGGELSLIHI